VRLQIARPGQLDKPLVKTDASWKQIPGAVVKGVFYLGEVYDCRRSVAREEVVLDDPAWVPVSVVEVTGLKEEPARDNLVAQFIHTDLERIGDLASAAETYEAMMIFLRQNDRAPFLATTRQAVSQPPTKNTSTKPYE
jgi:hypothetical protein